MKKVIIIIVSVIAALLVAMPLLRKYTKSHSPQETASTKLGNAEISVYYSRPFAKGRLIFGTEENGALVPYGKKWRTGANEATEIVFSTDVYVQGQFLAAGRYSLYTIPDKDRWVLAFNKKTGYWGINPFGETFDESQDAIRVSSSVLYGLPMQEQFLIDFTVIDDNYLTLNLKWSDAIISTLIALNP